MIKRLSAAVSLGLLLTIGTADAADNQKADHDDEVVTFSELTLADGRPDDGICEKRYKSGFTTAELSGTPREPDKKTSGQEPRVIISSTGGTIGDGILSMENEYELIFPNEKNTEPVEMKVFATALIGSGSASGVFSDGTCRGKVTIHSTQ
ncbi:hypothetical protein PsAD2_00320 [Pseudovibrio axinellae]|uniref:Uncharacterized protein n=1 Tax=Pseudovibrio axinellae TaxID=989403 RepID=A0A166B4X6_9HYPH|nr:hypothetical protein [Pseudovibrio axinellae]KZL21891.1 hypothetical protein PsAD2_00320 [Pseudovibrio axinellae]SEQ82611.1 hypothetical protein SAMN05421798_104318 [Pseudovibrio axinellae]